MGEKTDPAGDNAAEDVTTEMSPAGMLAFAGEAVPQALVAASCFAMHEALRLVAFLDGIDAGARSNLLEHFEHPRLAAEAHALIVGHPGLPPDALWLHLTARELMPRTAESYAELPGWQRHGFKLFIASYEALWPVIKAGLEERQEVLRLAAEQERPTPRVKLSDTIFERHGHISELIDGLRLNPRR